MAQQVRQVQQAQLLLFRVLRVRRVLVRQVLRALIRLWLVLLEQPGQLVTRVSKDLLARRAQVQLDQQAVLGLKEVLALREPPALRVLPALQLRLVLLVKIGRAHV